MSVDITQLADQLIAEYKQETLAAVADSAPDIVSSVIEWGNAAEQRLKDTAINTLNSELPYDFVVRRLKEEEITLKDTLIAIGQMVASDIQSLATKLINIFVELLKSAILSLSPIV